MSSFVYFWPLRRLFVKSIIPCSCATQFCGYLGVSCTVLVFIIWLSVNMFEYDLFFGTEWCNLTLETKLCLRQEWVHINYGLDIKVELRWYLDPELDWSANRVSFEVDRHISKVTFLMLLFNCLIYYLITQFFFVHTIQS